MFVIIVMLKGVFTNTFLLSFIGKIYFHLAKHLNNIVTSNFGADS